MKECLDIDLVIVYINFYAPDEWSVISYIANVELDWIISWSGSQVIKFTYSSIWKPKSF